MGFKKSFAAVLIIAASFWLLRGLLVSESSRIKKLFEEGALLASFDEGETHPLEKLGGARKLAARFEDNVVFKLKREEGVKTIGQGRQTVIDKFLLVRNSLAQLAVGFKEFTVEVQGSRATVQVTASAMGRDPGRTDYFLEKHRIICELQKSAGEWLIYSVQNVEPYKGELGEPES